MQKDHLRSVRADGAADVVGDAVLPPNDTEMDIANGKYQSPRVVAEDRQLDKGSGCLPHPLFLLLTLSWPKRNISLSCSTASGRTTRSAAGIWSRHGSSCRWRS